MLVVAQVNTVEVGGVIAGDGARIFCVTIEDAEAEHPFAPVTVTE